MMDYFYHEKAEYLYYVAQLSVIVSILNPWSVVLPHLDFGNVSQPLLIKLKLICQNFKNNTTFNI